MKSLRNILLLGGLLVLSACASQTIEPDQAPEYVITRNFTPFYQEHPKQGADYGHLVQRKNPCEIASQRDDI